MELKFDRRFLRDVRKTNDATLLRRVEKALGELKTADSLEEVRSVSKLSGFADCYRMRVGDYRIGLIRFSDRVEVVRFLHRSVVYERFP
jgi:mRNA interferase RelE/StbE